jgi:beta-galactosidase
MSSEFLSKYVYPLLYVLALVAVYPVNAATSLVVPKASKQSFNNDWQYLEHNFEKLELAKNHTDWLPISLPHTWNAIDTVDGAAGYRRSASWYKKTLNVDTDNKVTKLYFEGANFETQVYLNGKLVGEHIGGYLGFEIDLTDGLKDEQDNEVLVRVSNRFNPNLIPSQKADFFLFGGITRDVWLVQLPETYIDQMLVKTPKVSAKQASTQIEATVISSETKELSLTVELFDSSAKQVTQATTKFNAKVGENKVLIDLPDIQNPQLWSTDSPYLYQVKTSVKDDNSNIHSELASIGYRWFEMKPHQGFFLNGKPLLIRGTHRHEEHAGVGAALSNEQHRTDMQMIKDMGANFVRLGHYPQDPEVYKAADELGLLIWDELPWCRGGKGGQEWEDNTERLWRSQVQQNYNHPSIVFWSLGNEIYWEEDFPGGGATELINPYLEKLNTITKQLDPSRLTSIRKYYPGSELVDAFSPSIWAGWYGGSYNQYEAALKNAHDKYPTFLHMEYGGSSHVGRHTETPVSAEGIQGIQVSVEEAVNQAVVKSVAKDSDWNENYIVDLFDWHLNVSENMQGFAGNAQWAFKDFGSPLRPENPIPYMNQKGLVDRAGNKKDAYHVFASYWSEKPVCWIESDTWTERNGPKEGRDVTVYCNTQSAELYLNGASLGKKDKQKGAVPAGGFVWKVPFKNGDNSLLVKGFNGKKQVTEGSQQVRYLIGEHDKFKRIELTKTKLDGNRWLVTAEAQDKDGNRVLDYSERAYFFNIGDQGKLLENFGTPNRSSVIEMASGLASIEYEQGDKPSIIEFRTQNIKGVYLNVGDE